jgi:putative addiction module component (TIGR02574 family)
MELLTPNQILLMTPPERLELIERLWDSLDNDVLPLTGAQEAELDHRLASLDDDRQNAVTWESLKAELERRCQ